MEFMNSVARLTDDSFRCLTFALTRGRTALSEPAAVGCSARLGSVT